MFIPSTIASELASERHRDLIAAAERYRRAHPQQREQVRHHRAVRATVSVNGHSHDPSLRRAVSGLRHRLGRWIASTRPGSA
jgi:hypothetical protein